MMTNISPFISSISLFVGLLLGIFLTIYAQKQSLDAMQKIATGDSVTSKEDGTVVSDTTGEDYSDDEEYDDDH